MIEAHVEIGGIHFHVRDGELQITDPDGVLDNPEGVFGDGPMMTSESLETAWEKLRFITYAAKQARAQEVRDGE